MAFIRLLALLGFIILSSGQLYSQSQVFTKKAAPGEIVSRFGYAYDPSMAFGDIDADGDEDVIICGTFRSSLPDFDQDVSAIYINDGNGAFQKRSSNCFPSARDVPTFLHDVDGDNDLDFILTGIDQGASIELYLNDGLGGFKKSDSTTFPIYTDYDVALGDINNDGIQDIVVSSSQFKVHLGDGNGGFGDTLLSQVDGLTNCALLIDDLNYDGISDIIATGEFNGSPTFRYYQGQGNLSFNQITTAIPGLTEDPSLALGDVNKDGYLDIGIMGEDANDDPVTKIYASNSGSTFYPLNISNLLQLQEGDIHLVDFNGDGNLDIFATGVYSISRGAVCALKNTNPGWTTIATDDFINLLESGRSDFQDVNGDNLPELFLAGASYDPYTIQSGFSYIICEFLNHGNDNFYRTDGSHFWNETIKYKTIGDFNGDGYLDIIAGGTPYPSHWTEAYINDGSGNFNTASINLATYKNTVAIDANGDSLMDLVGLDQIPNQKGPAIFLNTGVGYNFTRDSIYIDFQFEEGTISVEDIDGDGDDDFTYMSEMGNGTVYKLKAMLNNGTGQFTELNLASPPIIAEASKTMFADFNLDGHLDLFFPKVKRLYYWDQSIQEYAEDTTFPTGAVAYSRGVPYASIADFDNNGRYDIMIGLDSHRGTGGGHFDLIFQDTNGVFTYDPTFTFPPSVAASIDTADFDQDGDIDVVYAGTDLPHHDYLAMILENDGQGNFSQYPYHELTRMSHFTWFMDTDNDGDHDIMQVGKDYNRERYIGQVHENHVCAPIDNDTVVSTCSSSFKWDVTGCEYKASGTYTTRFVNAQNCYEFYKLNLEIKGFEVQVNKLDTGLVSTVDTFTSYQWYDCSSGTFTSIAGETNSAFYPGNNGSYALVATNAEGCSDTSECLSIENISVHEPSNHLNLSIYPNPTSSFIRINGMDQEMSFRITDFGGRGILRGTLKPQERLIDISNLKNGVYLLKISTNGKSQLFKVSKI